uniref:Uncharacterized protein n=1 Tax=Salmonella phage SalP219 TaxID=3158864 RepID=A0AAU7PIK1_9CAUD
MGRRPVFGVGINDADYKKEPYYDDRVGFLLKSVYRRIENEIKLGQETKYLLNEKETTNVES